jgi:AcrR family transcriptional regulator
MTTKRNLTPRNKPVQPRAQKQINNILSTTAQLLDQVGQDDLTTILVAKHAGISVGTLYHYFPNKYAIMYSLAEQWVDEMQKAIDELEAEDIEKQSIKIFVEFSIQRIMKVYLNQKGLLPMVQAMYGVPELQSLDNKHDEIVIKGMARMFERLGISNNKDELLRLGQAYLEISHALLLIVVDKSEIADNKTLADLKFLILSLLERAKGQF